MEQPTSSSTAEKHTGKARALGVSLGLTIAATGLSAVAGLLIAIPLFILGLDIESTAVIVSLLIGGQIGFLAVGYLYVHRYSLSIPTDRPERRDLGYAIGGAIVALVFATGASSVLTWLGLTPGAVLEEIITQNPVVALWMALRLNPPPQQVAVGVRLLQTSPGWFRFARRLLSTWPGCDVLHYIFRIPPDAAEQRGSQPV